MADSANEKIIVANANANGKVVVVDHSPISPTVSKPESSFDHAAETRLLRKLDLRILPVLWILYLVNFIDRSVGMMFPV